MNKNVKNVVQFPNVLVSGCNEDVSVRTIKLFSIALAKTGTYNFLTSEISFSKRESEKILGVERLNLPSLRNLVNELANIRITDSSIINTNSNKTLDAKAVNIFSSVETKVNMSGERQIIFNVNPLATDYVFHTERNGYFKLNLDAVMALNSKSSIFMLMYLAQNYYRGKWTVSVKDLRNYLKVGCKKYKTAKDFNKFILKSSFNDITSILGIDYSYAFKKDGKNIISIEFTFNGSKKDFIEPPAFKWEKETKEFAAIQKEIDNALLDENAKINEDSSTAVSVIPVEEVKEVNADTEDLFGDSEDIAISDDTDNSEDIENPDNWEDIDIFGDYKSSFDEGVKEDADEYDYDSYCSSAYDEYIPTNEENEEVTILFRFFTTDSDADWHKEYSSVTN